MTWRASHHTAPVGLTRAYLLAAALLVLAWLAPEAADAHDRRLPYHEVGALVCGQSLVRAYPPRVMRSWQYLPDYRKVEMVWWSPDLWKYVGRRWRLVDQSRPWFRAFTTSIGYYQAPYSGAWTNPRTNYGQVIFVPYYNLSRGYYKIKNFMEWGYNGRRHAQFSGYCYVS